jgi:hypothetical protein
LWIQIADNQGVETTYSVKPLTFNPPQAAARAFTLTKYKGLQPRQAYQCILDTEGGLSCTCPGFTHAKHCKHLDALRASGLLVPSEYLTLRGLQLECERLQRECEERMKVKRIGGPSRASKRAHARRLREECEQAVPMQPTLQTA